jgi:hypothetical protein
MEIHLSTTTFIEVQQYIQNLSPIKLAEKIVFLVRI